MVPHKGSSRDSWKLLVHDGTGVLEGRGENRASRSDGVSQYCANCTTPKASEDIGYEENRQREYRLQDRKTKLDTMPCQCHPEIDVFKERGSCSPGKSQPCRKVEHGSGGIDP